MTKQGVFFVFFRRSSVKTDAIDHMITVLRS